MNFPGPTERHAGWGFTLVFALMAAGIVTAGYRYYRNFELNYRSEVESELSAIADLKVDELVQYRKERLGDADTFYNNSAFSELVRRFLQQPADADAQRRLQSWLGRFQAYYGYARINLFDVQGAERLAVPDKPEPLPGHMARDIAAVLRSGQMTFLDFHRDAPGLPVQLEILVPVFDGSDTNRPLGVLVLRIDPEISLYPFIKLWPVPSKTAETLLVRRDGNDVLFLNELKFATNTALNRRISLENTNTPAVKAVLGQTGTVEGVDYRGVPVLAALQAVPDSPWFLVARMDTAEVFAPMRERLWQVIVMIGVLLFGSLACVGLVWRQQRVRFYRAKFEMEAFRTKLGAIIESSEYAIISKNLDGIITSWNPSAERIYGYSAAEAIGKSIEILIPPGNPNEFPQLIEKIKRGEAVEHYETERIRKNGERIQVQLSLSPVKDEAGAIVGVLVIGYDITERKQAEEALRESEARYHAMLEQAADAVFTHDKTGRILDVNQKACQSLGYSRENLLSKSIGDIDPEAIQAGKHELWDKILAGEHFTFESHQRCKDGSSIPVEVSLGSVRLPRGQVILGFARNITERKRAEKALRGSETELHTILESTGDGILAIDSSGEKIIKANRRFAEMWRVPQSLIDAGDNRALRNFVLKQLSDPDAFLKKLQSLYGTETADMDTLTFKDGRIFERHGFPMITNGVVTGRVWSFRDITERKRAETDLRKINRAMRMISLCNQEMVRATDEAALLQTICQIIVEHGGYRMAWVGFAEQDEARSVRPVAKAGFEEGYLDNLNITWADAERGRGPTGTVIRTGQPVQTRNILTDPAFAPWRAAAIQRGYGSSIALPLHGGGRCFGALMIYAAEPDAFDAEEVKLMGELAGDLAYGIDVLRQQAERERAEAALHRRTGELAALNSLTKGVSSSLSLETVVAAALRELLNAVKTDVAFLFLREGEKLVLGGIAPESGRERFGQIPEHRVGECMCGLAVRQGRPLYSRDIFSDLRCTWEECKKAGYRSFAALPLSTGDEIIGVVSLASATERDFEQQAGFLETLANAVSASLQNARLFAETKQAQEVLRRSQEEFKDLFDNAPVGFHELDAAGRIVRINNIELKMLGYAAEELLGQFIWKLSAEEETSRRTVLAKLAGEMPPSEGFERLFRRKDGTTFPVLITDRLLKRADGAIIGIHGAVQDITERKRAEQRVTDALNFNQTVLRASPVGIVVFKAAGPCVSANEAIGQIIGGSREEVLKQNFRQLESWKNSGMLAAAEAALAMQAERKLETQMLTTFGRKVWCACRFVPFQYEGEPHLLLIIGDITERKQVEEEIARTAREWQTTFDATRDAIWILDPNHRILRTNKTAESYFQRPCSEMMGKPCWEIVHGTTEPIPDCPFVRSRKSGRRETMDLQTRERWFEVIVDPIFDTAGQYAGAVHIVSDITERKRAEERIREQAALLDAANDAIYVRALDHTVTYWNDGAERLYGRTRAEVLGRKIIELGEVDREAFETAHAALLEQGSWSGELKKINKAGKGIIVFCRWTLLRDEQNQPKEVLAINTDITEQKQLEANFLRAQRMEGIGALAGGIAHDLNNILQPILMTAPLLRETTSDPENCEMLDTVESCARRGADIIRQLLTFARGEPGVRVPLPVRHLMHDMDKIIRETFPRNIQLNINAPKDLWQVMGDATQIHQSLMNLCVNARDAMPDGGTLTLAAENLTLDEAFAAMMPGAKSGFYVCVSVADTGMGIPPENLERIFDPFFTTKEIGKGTGLGLPTVLGIVRGHGGFVRVNSQVGKGTTFELYLPASSEAKAAARPKHETLPPRADGELILVVDDEASIRGVVWHTLEKHGYRVVIAAEGAEAMGLFARHRAEVRAVLTDMMMPGMDGPALVRALRQQEPQLPIIGMTGVGEKADIKGLEALGLVVLLTKPFNSAGLLGVLHQALAAPRKANSKAGK